MHPSMNKSVVVVVCLTFCFLAVVCAQEPDAQSDAQGIALRKALDLQAITINLEFSRNHEWRDDQLTNLKNLLSDQIEGETKLLDTFTEPQALEKRQLGLQKLRVRAACVEQNTKLVDGHSVLTKKDLKMEKARILFKPEATFSSEAIKAHRGGFVVLRAVFAADGLVKFIQPIQSARYGLTEEAIKAASLIRFKPESICGKAVSSTIQLEYNFGDVLR